MKKNIYGVMIIVISILVTSCVNTKRYYYFNDQLPSVQQFDSLKNFAIKRIQSLDRINIIIGSTDPVLTSYLNPFTTQSSQSSQTASNSQNVTGYLVNAEGSIEFPLLGKVPVAGLTSVEASKLIKEKLSYYYKDLFVNVNITSRVYFINGRQGTTIPINNERLTIFEALSQSGSQDAFDYKNKVWLIREDSGQRYFVQLDLNSKKIFESPYYYLHSNDLIYLQPGKYSSLLGPSSPFRSMFAIIGTVTALLVIIKQLL